MEDNFYSLNDDYSEYDEEMDAEYVFNQEDEEPLMLAEFDQVAQRTLQRQTPRTPQQRRDRYDRGGRQFPLTPPPSYIPRRPYPYRNPYPLRQCLYGFDYIWMNDGRSFWARLTNVTPSRVEGYRWDGNRWRWFSVNNRDINNYVCL